MGDYGAFYIKAMEDERRDRIMGRLHLLNLALALLFIGLLIG